MGQSQFYLRWLKITFWGYNNSYISFMSFMLVLHYRRLTLQHELDLQQWSLCLHRRSSLSEHPGEIWLRCMMYRCWWGHEGPRCCSSEGWTDNSIQFSLFLFTNYKLTIRQWIIWICSERSELWKKFWALDMNKVLS